VLAKLQEQHLARERELDSREGIVVAWEESLVAFACTLTEVHVGHDAIHVHMDAIWRHYLTQVSASNSPFDRHKALRRSLDERAAHLRL
jgi:hypothetical protein